MPVLSRFVQRERPEPASERVNAVVLEFGRGQANILGYAGQHIKRYAGIDRRSRIPYAAKQRHPDHTFVEPDAASKLFAPQGFDLVYRLRSDRDGR